jgi:hypothetical protein
MSWIASNRSRWRDRAKELRALAKRLQDAPVKEAMLRLANGYDDLANRWPTELDAAYAMQTMGGADEWFVGTVH